MEAASRAQSAYALASAWGESAPVSETGTRAAAAVAGGASRKALPQQQRRDADARAAAGDDGAASGAALATTAQFYKWHGELSAVVSAERAEKYQHYARVLQDRVEACARVLAEVDGTMARFDELRSQHQSVGSQARSLAAACERLLEDKARLGEFAGALRAKLVVFEQLDALAAALHGISGAGAAAAVEQLPPLLRGCDECLEFCAQHPQYADASAYALKFRQLQARALSALRATVGVVLRRAVAAAEEAAAEAAAAAGGTASSMPEGAATGVLYVRFRAAAPEVRPLLAYAESRAAAGVREYMALLGDVRALYAEARLSLLQAWVAERIAACGADGEACSLARAGSAFLLALAAEEHALFDHFFPGASSSSGGGGASASALQDGGAAALLPLIEPLAVPLYDALRPALLALRDLEPLAELVDVLRREVLGEAAARHGDAVAAALPTLRRVLADAQERLAFRAHTYLKQEVASYVPTQDDIDAILRIATAAAEAPAAAPAEARTTMPLYRPVAAALGALARLYGALEPVTFGALAQEAVEAATCAVAAATGALSAASASKGQAAMDTHLFVASQLLALREQTASFDAEFVVTERALEFSSMRGTLRRILSGGAPLFSMSDNGLFALAARGAPRTVESRHDGRKDLEAALKAACEAFILSVTKTAVEPLLGFLAKSTAARGAANPGKLRDQAFAAVERVTELVAATNASMGPTLAEAAQRSRAYLPAGSTRAVLFRPIKANIAEAHAQMAAVLEAEYKADEVAAMGLLGPDALRRLLDAHDDE